MKIVFPAYAGVIPSKAAHPQMRELTVPLLGEFKEKIPVVFDDIKVEE